MTRRLCQFFASLGVLGGSLSAQTLFGVTGSDGAASNLYTVNITTGATTLIGATGFSGVGALAFAPNGTTLYGVANSGHRLITINTSTGVGTAVSASATGTGNIADIAFRADGVLFAAAGSDGVAPLYTINTTTGIATLIGTMAGSGGGNALAFNATGTLFLDANSGLYTVNPVTAATILVATPNFGDPFSQSEFAGMKFHPSSGVLYGTTIGELGSLSTFTGSPTVTFLGSTSVALEAVAFGTASAPPPPPPTGVPAPSTLLLFGTGLAIAAAWSFLRGRRTMRT
jgi:WD40 repeat protein